MNNTSFLRIPLNKLSYIDDVSNFNGLTEKDITDLNEEYTDEELTNIKESVAWAVNNPEYDFSSLLPNISHSNADIYNFLNKVHKTINI